METKGIWKEVYTIPAYEVDANQNAKLVAICNWIQNIAGNHAHFRDMGYDAMQAKGTFWALSRLKTRVLRYPKWRQEVELHTWISSLKGPFSNRHFHLLDAKTKAVLAEASMLWVLVAIESRRPARIGEVSMPVLEDKLPICGLAGKVPAFDGPFTKNEVHQVVYRDLDMVGHVNNVKYMEWIIDSFDQDRSAFEVESLDVNFLSETHLNESLRICSAKVQEEQEQYRVELRKEPLNTIACRAMINWRNSEELK